MSQGDDGFPKPTKEDLIRQLYGMLDPLDTAALLYLKAHGLKPDASLRSMDPCGIVDLPSFGAARLLVFPVYTPEGALNGLFGRWLQPDGRGVPGPVMPWVFNWPRRGAMRFGWRDDARAIALAVTPETAMLARERLSLPAMAVFHHAQLERVTLPDDAEIVVIAERFPEAAESVDSLVAWLHAHGRGADVMSTMELLQ